MCKFASPFIHVIPLQYYTKQKKMNCVKIHTYIYISKYEHRSKFD